MFEEENVWPSMVKRMYTILVWVIQVSSPKEVKEAIIKILNEEDPNLIHGYMNNSGYEDVREKIAQSLNQRFQTSFDENNIIMTVGAAGGLNVIFKVILNPGDEVITFAPFFGEYKNYVSNYDGKLVVVSPIQWISSQILLRFSNKITKNTKAVIINTPNNPTGVVYSEETIKDLSRF